ncbi:Uncharacterised protein [Anaerotruncus colihominis]|uniref:Uncharacterized protein n=1 Tax=Anaerotruncus colihominis TaxID=169435 RepID=A0A174SX38_9FIRM|nr:Uncharacterised protein [Anaerotruncus colihominis]
MMIFLMEYYFFHIGYLHTKKCYPSCWIVATIMPPTKQ